jgi:two-component system OmpR family sensor kinase
MLVFLSFIFYDKMQDESAYIRNNIFLEMKNYSLGFDDKRFHMEYVENTQKQKPYTLYEDAKSVYILIPSSMPDPKEMVMVMSPSGTIMVPYAGESESREVMKVWYPRSEYRQRIRQMQKRLLGQYLLFVLAALIVAMLAAWYTLRPLRSSLRLLEDFIKDIIHDLNTPLSAIILNLKMIQTKDEEIESIRIAAQTIEMLHHNLDSYIKERHQSEEVFEVGKVVEAYIRFFTPLYDYLLWDVEMEKLTVSTDKQACSRIIYNLLSNACKYNISDGKIVIRLEGTVLSIQNSSYGVKHPERVFERFYKESERGLGIGLHIVDKLCHSLGIKRRFTVEGTDVTVTLECSAIATSDRA